MEQPLSQDEQLSRVKEICQPFDLTNEQLLNIKQDLLSEINKGLKAATNKQSSIKCWPAFVQEYPCGCEHGIFLVLEIRNQNFHISFIHLKGAHGYQHEKETHEIPEELSQENAERFFYYLIDKLKKFLKQHQLDRENLSMALCISFPLRHTSLKSAEVQNLNKNLNLKKLVGKEVVQLLQDAIDQEGLRVKVDTVLNNSTAILLANSWQEDHCSIGINIGHGCNAVYMERAAEIEMLTEQTLIPHMVVNTEWGNFGANGHLANIWTDFDQQVDDVSSDKGKQKFEKLTSALYLGELARQIFLKCASEKVLFDGNISNNLNTPFSLTSAQVSSILAEKPSIEFTQVRLQFASLGISELKETECFKIQYILQSIAQRSAKLVACGISSLSQRIPEKRIVVALGGSFYLKCHDFYEKFLKKTLKNLLSTERTLKLTFFENDVVIGSALSAAIIRSKDFVYNSEEVVKLFEQSVNIGRESNNRNSV